MDKSLLREARLAGALYLIIIVCAGFSQGVVRQSVLSAGSASEVADALRAAATLWNVALAADLIAFMCDIGVAVLLYRILKPVHATLAMTAAAFRLIAHPAIGSLNLLNHEAALHVLQDAGWQSAFGPAQLAEISVSFLHAHHMGYLIAGALFGVHCLLLGYLIVRSERFPSLLGWLLGAASLGYLIESFGTLFYPEGAGLYALGVGLTAGVAEVALCLWLLIKGVRPAASDM